MGVAGPDAMCGPNGHSNSPPRFPAKRVFIGGDFLQCLFLCGSIFVSTGIVDLDLGKAEDNSFLDLSAACEPKRETEPLQPWGLLPHVTFPFVLCVGWRNRQAFSQDGMLGANFVLSALQTVWGIIYHTTRAAGTYFLILLNIFGPMLGVTFAMRILKMCQNTKMPNNGNMCLYAAAVIAFMVRSTADIGSVQTAIGGYLLVQSFTVHAMSSLSIKGAYRFSMWLQLVMISLFIPSVVIIDNILCERIMQHMGEWRHIGLHWFTHSLAAIELAAIAAQAHAIHAESKREMKSD